MTVPAGRPMTAPADPREPRTEAGKLLDVPAWHMPRCIFAMGVRRECTCWLRARIVEIEDDAARQDEPSPALREAAQVVVAIWHRPDPMIGFQGALRNLEAALAANPPQTREAEGAAPDGD